MSMSAQSAANYKQVTKGAAGEHSTRDHNKLAFSQPFIKCSSYLSFQVIRLVSQASKMGARITKTTTTTTLDEIG